MSVCSKFCNKCCFRNTFHQEYIYCDYLCMTGHRRPCPAGDGCTVKQTGRYQRKRVPIEQLTSKPAKKRERNRQKARAYYEKHKDEINARAREKRAANREI